MTKQPEITLSSLDVDRLYSIIESLPNKDLAGLDALENELDRANIVAPEEMPPTIVTMNSTVKFTVEETGSTFELTLVYPKDVDASGRTISIFAPVGSALIGLSIGDQIEWPKPGGGIMKVTIDDIAFQPERAGAFHR